MKCGQCGADIMLGAAACGRCGWSPLGAAPVPPADDLGGGDPFVGGDSSAPTFAPPPPPPPGYTPPPPPAPGSLAAQVAPATSTAKPVPQGGSSGCGCLGFIVLIAVAAAGVGIFFGIRNAGDTVDGIGDIFDSSSDFDDERFDGPRVDGEPIELGTVVAQQQLGDDEVAVHPLDGITGTVTIRAFGVNAFDPFVRVETADGDVLDEDDDGGDGTDSLLTLDLDGQPGTVLLVTNFSGAPGPYTVVVLPGDGAALPTVGSALAVGEPTGGILLEAGQQVSHPFTGTGGPVAITVSSVAGFDPVVTVFDATGNQLARNDDFSPETGRDARVDLTVASGAQVTVQVSGFGSSTGPYLVTVAAG